MDSIIHKTILFPLVIVVTSTIAMPAVAKPKLPTNAVTAVEQTLKQYYGSNQQQGCLLFSYGEKADSKSLYCVKVANTELKTLNNQAQLYVLVSGDFAEESGAGHPTPGIGGLFIFNQIKDQWKLVASNPYIVNGAFGSSQLDSFKLVQVAPNKFGWLGDFGYTSTGCTESSNYLYAQVGNKVKPIYNADSPDVNCSGNGDGWDSYESSVSILTQKPAINGFYPILIKATEYDYPDDHNVKKGKVKKYSYQMTYKANTQKYTR